MEHTVDLNLQLYKICLPEGVIVPSKLQTLELGTELSEAVDHVVHVDLGADGFSSTQYLKKGFV